MRDKEIYMGEDDNNNNKNIVNFTSYNGIFQKQRYTQEEN